MKLIEVRVALPQYPDELALISSFAKVEVTVAFAFCRTKKTNPSLVAFAEVKEVPVKMPAKSRSEMAERMIRLGCDAKRSGALIRNNVVPLGYYLSCRY